MQIPQTDRWIVSILIHELSDLLGNGVTVAQQILALLV